MAVEVTNADNTPVEVPARFEIRGELGRGGMAVVYHAYDTVGEKDVALKFLPPTEDENLRKRFQREAVDLAGVYHPNVVEFYSLGESRGQEFIEMEYVCGGTLSRFQSRCDSLATILNVYAQICEGLAHIHECGLVHRDIKPANVLMTTEGVPKISDLGLARRAEGRTQLTQDGTILGTASYLAPEQLMSHAVGASADIYALGVCLFEAVTCRQPFQASTPLAMVRAHVEDKPPVPSEVMPGLPTELDGLILSMMEKKPEKRPSDLNLVAARLREIVRSLTPDQDSLVASSPEALLGRVRLHLRNGNSKEALSILDQLDDSDQSLRLTILCERARALLLDRRPNALDSARLAVNEARDKQDRGQLGRALLVYGQAATEGRDWATAMGALKEARDLIPSSERESQVELMSTLSKLHREGSAAGHEGLSSEEGQRYADIAKGLSKRLDSSGSAVGSPTSPSVTAKAPAAAAVPSPSAKPSRRRLALPLALAVLVLLLVGGATHAFLNRPGKIEIASDPSGATVTVNDGEERHTTPYLAELPAGEYTVKVYQPGHFPYEETVTLAAGESFKLNATLKPSSGNLNLTSKPAGAKVFFDGQSRGKTPVELTGLPLKTYKVKFVKEGYKPHEESIEVQPGKTRNLEFALSKIPPPPQPVYQPSYNSGYSGSGRTSTGSQGRSSTRSQSSSGRRRSNSGYRPPKVSIPRVNIKPPKVRIRF